MNNNLSAIFLTGNPGVGKTTIIKKILEEIPFNENKSKFNGFYTEEIRILNRREGFDVINLNGEKEILARSSSTKKGPTVGKYVVYVENFESIALPIFNGNSRYLIIDEIGKMELFSKNFEIEIRKLLPKIISGEMKVIATIPNKKIQLVDELKSLTNSRTFTITTKNRNAIYNEIKDCFVQIFH